MSLTASLDPPIQAMFPIIQSHNRNRFKFNQQKTLTVKPLHIAKQFKWLTILFSANVSYLFNVKNFHICIKQ